MIQLAALEQPVRISSRSEALLASLVGRFTRFNVVDGRIFLDSSFDARGIVIEHFAERTNPRRQTFLYLAGNVGREQHRRAWGIRELTVLPRLPIGLFKACYHWRPKLQSYGRKSGTEVITSSGGLHRLARIEVFSELISFDDGDEEIERTAYAEADRRICFTYESGESIAVEADDCGNQPLLITKSEHRPIDRSFETLKSRLVLTQADPANSTSIGH